MRSNSVAISEAARELSHPLPLHAIQRAVQQVKGNNFRKIRIDSPHAQWPISDEYPRFAPKCVASLRWADGPVLRLLALTAGKVLIDCYV